MTLKKILPKTKTTSSEEATAVKIKYLRQRLREQEAETDIKDFKKKGK